MRLFNRDRSYSSVRPIDAPAVPLRVYIPLLQNAIEDAMQLEAGPLMEAPDSNNYQSPEFRPYYNEYHSQLKQLIASRNAIEEAKPQDDDLLPLHWATVAYTRCLSGSVNYFFGMLAEDLKGNRRKAQKFSDISTDWEQKTNMMMSQVADACGELRKKNQSLFDLLALPNRFLDLLQKRGT